MSSDPDALASFVNLQKVLTCPCRELEEYRQREGKRYSLTTPVYAEDRPSLAVSEKTPPMASSDLCMIAVRLQHNHSISAQVTAWSSCEQWSRRLERAIDAVRWQLMQD